MADRSYQVVELDGRRHVASVLEPSETMTVIGVRGIIVLARLDGTEPVAIFEIPGGLACTCDQGHRDRLCRHMEAAMRAGLLGRWARGPDVQPYRPPQPPASRLGLWGQMRAAFNGEPVERQQIPARLAPPQLPDRR